MGTTPNYKWPFPEGGDTPDVPRDMGGLAGAIDATVAGQAVTTGFTVATGWSLTSLNAMVYADLVWVELTVKRTGANLVAGANGGFTDATRQVGTVPKGLLPSANYPLNWQITNGSRSGIVAITGTGAVWLQCAGPGITIGKDESIILCGTYRAAPVTARVLPGDSIPIDPDYPGS